MKVQTCLDGEGPVIGELEDIVLHYIYQNLYNNIWKIYSTEQKQRYKEHVGRLQ